MMNFRFFCLFNPQKLSRHNFCLKGHVTRKSSNAIFLSNLVKYVSMNTTVNFSALRVKMAKLCASKHRISGKR